MKFTIAYLTNRQEPMFEWFLESLHRQALPGQRVIIVDYHAGSQERRDRVSAINRDLGLDILHIAPKPSIWQGAHKRVPVDAFDASGARNTALLHCVDDFIVYADDLSVLSPEWHACVSQGVNRRGWTYGSYRKVKNLTVKYGNIVSYSDNPHGHDPRRAQVRTLHSAAACDPRWLFGCSLVAPVEELLDIGGWPEQACGGMGYEDGALARILFNRKAKTWFDPRMMTYESEEHHHIPGNHFARWDPCKGDPNANPRDDKSHALMRLVENAHHTPMEGNIRKARQDVLDGKGYPPLPATTHDWFTGAPLSDIK